MSFKENNNFPGPRKSEGFSGKQEIVLIKKMESDDTEITVMDLPGVGPATAEKLAASGYEPSVLED